jgi:hypothetical protein
MLKWTECLVFGWKLMKTRLVWCWFDLLSILIVSKKWKLQWKKSKVDQDSVKPSIVPSLSETLSTKNKDKSVYRKIDGNVLWSWAEPESSFSKRFTTSSCWRLSLSRLVRKMKISPNFFDSIWNWLKVQRWRKLLKWFQWNLQVIQGGGIGNAWGSWGIWLLECSEIENFDVLVVFVVSFAGNCVTF